MEHIEEVEPFCISIGKLDISPYANKFKTFGFGFQVGEGVFWQSIRLELTVPFFYFGVHFIWDNRSWQ